MSIFNVFRTRAGEQARIDRLTGECEKLVVERDMMREENYKLQRKLDEQLRSARAEAEELKQKAKLQREEIEQKHRLADDEVRHLVKIKESKFDIELAQKKIEIEAAKAQEINELRADYQKKLESNLEKQIGDIKGMYSEIIKLLPNVNVKLGMQEKTSTRG